jgi:hypothetical protein
MIANQNKINLKDVKGTGKRHRITKCDIINYVEHLRDNLKKVELK